MKRALALLAFIPLAALAQPSPIDQLAIEALGTKEWTAVLLRAQIEAFKAENTKLKGEIEALKAELDKLKSRPD